MKIKYCLLSLLVIAPFAANSQTLDDQLQSIRAAQEKVRAEEAARQNQLKSEYEARQRIAQDRERQRQEQLIKAEKERQQQSHEIERKRIEANLVIEKERLAAERERQARAAKERARIQAFEEEQRRLDLMERKAELATRRTRADRANDFIDRELSREDAKINVVNSNADANRSAAEGTRDMLRGVGKGVERHGLGKQ